MLHNLLPPLANGHIMLNTPVLIRLLKLSLVSTWMGDRLGTLGAVGFNTLLAKFPILVIVNNLVDSLAARD